MLTDAQSLAAAFEGFVQTLPVLAKTVFGEVEHGTEHLTLAQFKVLALVGKSGPWRMSELSARLAVSPGSLTVMVDRLLEGGWLERDREPHDRRVVVVRLTPKGQSLYTQHRQHLLAKLEEHLQTLPQEKVRDLESSIKQVLEVIEALIGEKAHLLDESVI